MKTILKMLMCAALAAAPALAEAVDGDSASDFLASYGASEVVAEDVYDFSLRLKVPQVKDNNESLGYRKMEWQKIKGKMFVVWKADGDYELMFADLSNSDFKVRGGKVTYAGSEERYVVGSHFNWIGSNKKDVFKTPCLCFYLVLEPSYAQDKADEDNSFYILLSGSGSSKKLKDGTGLVARRLSGDAAGTQGCGCMLYGHKSPTRRAEIGGPSSTMTSDVVATFGTWRATWKSRSCVK